MRKNRTTGKSIVYLQSNDTTNQIGLGSSFVVSSGKKVGVRVRILNHESEGAETTLIPKSKQVSFEGGREGVST
jgi:hypothetical protein